MPPCGGVTICRQDQSRNFCGPALTPRYGYGETHLCAPRVAIPSLAWYSFCSIRARTRPLLTPTATLPPKLSAPARPIPTTSGTTLHEMVPEKGRRWHRWTAAGAAAPGSFSAARAGLPGSPSGRSPLPIRLEYPRLRHGRQEASKKTTRFCLVRQTQAFVCLQGKAHRRNKVRGRRLPEATAAPVLRLGAYCVLSDGGTGEGAGLAG